VKDRELMPQGEDFEVQGGASAARQTPR